MLYYLSLGSNIGDREHTLLSAIDLIKQQIGSVLCCSSYYYSAPWGFDSPNEFCNLCCAVDTPLAPLDMLHATQHIERSLGRIHKSTNGHYTDRPIDIDIILAYASPLTSNLSPLSFTTPELTIPHPLWEERDFVRIPLSQILSLHTPFGWSFAHFANECTGENGG